MRKLNIEKVKELMAPKDFNQSRLADEIGVDRSAVSGWFKGISQPSKANLERLAATLGSPAESLLSEDVESIGQQASPNLNPEFVYHPTVTHITVNNIDTLNLVLPEGVQNLQEILKDILGGGNGQKAKRS